MIELIFYVAVLLALGALTVFLLRQKGSYFRSVKILFVIGFLSIASMAVFDLIKNFLVGSEGVVLFTSIGGLSAVLITAIAVEHAAVTLFKRSREKVPSKTFFREKLNVLSVIYKGYTTTILIISWVFTPWQTQRVRNFWGELVYNPIMEWWYLVSLAIVLVAFIAYPCTLFYLASSKYRQRKVVSALRWLGLCWAGVGIVVMTYHGYLRSLEVETVSIGYLFQLIFFSIIAYFFKKTDILENFFEKPCSSIPFSGGESVLFTYTSETDKMKMFSTLIWEGLTSGKGVIYKYPDNEDKAVRKKLKEHGIDVEKREKDSPLILTTLSQFYFSDGVFDGEKAVRSLKELKADSLKKGYTQLIDFVDLGDFSFLGENGEKYIEYLNDKRWKTYIDEHVIELFAVNSEKIDKEFLSQLSNLQMHASLRSIHPIDLITQTNTFSNELGLTHRQITGSHILLDFDPSSNYEEIIGNFATEALANAEQVALFTHKGSAIYSVLSNKKTLKIILLTQSISVPQVDAQMNSILLPANNTSLMLDALDKTLKPLPQGNLNIIFDSLSSLILSVGLQKTYQFMRYALDMLASTNSTALFLFNPYAHDPRVTSGLRSLFSNHVSYRKEGLQIVKLSELKAEDA
ncbi:MAG: MEDS domain-containing protein [Candidatus Bathyarchaeota archaeon]|jgi:hypothetical protein